MSQPLVTPRWIKIET